MCRKQRAKIEIWPLARQLTPPQPSALAKSFPVPSGSTPTAGGGEKSSWSRMESTQPTVPSPPQANTLRLGTLRNISNLRAATNEPRFIRRTHTQIYRCFCRCNEQACGFNATANLRLVPCAKSGYATCATQTPSRLPPTTWLGNRFAPCR